MTFIPQVHTTLFPTPFIVSIQPHLGQRNRALSIPFASFLPVNLTCSSRCRAHASSRMSLLISSFISSGFIALSCSGSYTPTMRPRILPRRSRFDHLGRERYPPSSRYVMSFAPLARTILPVAGKTQSVTPFHDASPSPNTATLPPFRMRRRLIITVSEPVVALRLGMGSTRAQRSLDSRPCLKICSLAIKCRCFSGKLIARSRGSHVVTWFDTTIQLPSSRQISASRLNRLQIKPCSTP